jgi:hypothetical protein
MWQYTGSGTIAGAGPYDLSRSDDITPVLVGGSSSLKAKSVTVILAALSILGAAGYYIYNRLS